MFCKKYFMNANCAVLSLYIILSSFLSVEMSSPSASRSAISAGVTRSLSLPVRCSVVASLPWLPPGPPPLSRPGSHPPLPHLLLLSHPAHVRGGGVSRGSGPRTRSPGAPLVLCPSLREVTTNQAPILGTPVTETRALVRDNQILLAQSEITPHTKWPDQDTQHIQTFYPFTAGCKVFLTKVTKLSPGGGEFLRVLVRPKLDTELWAS